MYENALSALESEKDENYRLDMDQSQDAEPFL